MGADFDDILAVLSDDVDGRVAGTYGIGQDRLGVVLPRVQQVARDRREIQDRSLHCDGRGRLSHLLIQSFLQTNSINSSNLMQL